jgi:hypothetical protein
MIHANAPKWPAAHIADEVAGPEAPFVGGSVADAPN